MELLGLLNSAGVLEARASLYWLKSLYPFESFPIFPSKGDFSLHYAIGYFGLGFYRIFIGFHTDIDIELEISVYIEVLNRIFFVEWIFFTMLNNLKILGWLINKFLNEDTMSEFHCIIYSFLLMILFYFSRFFFDDTYFMQDSREFPN